MTTHKRRKPKPSEDEASVDRALATVTKTHTEVTQRFRDWWEASHQTTRNLVEAVAAYQNENENECNAPLDVEAILARIKKSAHTVAIEAQWDALVERELKTDKEHGEMIRSILGHRHFPAHEEARVENYTYLATHGIDPEALVHHFTS